jgi:hypothetical protein
MWDKETTDAYDKGKGVTVMVWGPSSSRKERSKLVLMVRDKDGAYGGIPPSLIVKHSMKDYSNIMN